MNTAIRKLHRVVERDGLRRALRLSIRTVYRRYVAERIALIRYHRSRLTGSSSAIAHPFNLLWVSPAEIEYVTDVDYQTNRLLDPSDQTYCEATSEDSEFHRYVERGSFKPHRDLGCVVGGTWDTERTEFEDLHVYTAMEEHFKEGVPWTETAYFQMMVERIENGYEQRSCATPEAYAERCSSFDELYDAMEQHGCVPKRFILGSFTFDEICVNVGRSGGLFFNTDGHHRLSIAKVLGLDSVPVLVVARHEQWQAKRERLASARGDGTLRDIDPVLLDHPDMADVLASTS